MFVLHALQVIGKLSTPRGQSNKVEESLNQIYIRISNVEEELRKWSSAWKHIDHTVLTNAEDCAVAVLNYLAANGSSHLYQWRWIMALFSRLLHVELVGICCKDDGSRCVLFQSFRRSLGRISRHLQNTKTIRVVCERDAPEPMVNGKAT